MIFLSSLHAYAASPEHEIAWWKFPVGFFFFAIFVLFSLYVKLQFTKKISERNYSEASFEAVSLDFFTIAINTAYAIWLYRFLYNY